MKTIVFKIGLLMLFILMVRTGCEKTNENGEYADVEYFKFSDFGCETGDSWYLRPGYVVKNYIIRSQQEFEECIAIECNPQIVFSNFVLLIGVKLFNSGALLFNEMVQENNSEVIYTITFLKDESTVALGIPYHSIVRKPLNGKSIRIVEIVKETL